jgi:hypothetical protein
LAQIRIYTSDGRYRGLNIESIRDVAILGATAVAAGLAAWFVRSARR